MGARRSGRTSQWRRVDPPSTAERFSPTGVPRFPLNFGQSPSGGPEYADYARGSGTTEIEFEWIVAETDQDTNGVFFYGDTDAQDRGELDLNAGTIRNAGTTVDADLTTSNRGTQAGHKVDGSIGGLNDATVAPILFGVPALAAAAETVDGVVHDATVAPILFGVPALAAAAETVDGVVHDATVAPILFGVPALAAAAETVDGVVHDATVAPILFGVPALAAAAAAETVAAPAFEGFLAPDGDRVLTGSSAAAQRLADALRIQRGSYPFLRDYGSTLALLVDRRPAIVFAAVAEALIHPTNGLDDIELRAVRVSPAGAGAVVVEVDAEWRPAPAAASTPISIREQLQPAP